jgi:hypothetical protein
MVLEPLKDTYLTPGLQIPKNGIASEFFRPAPHPTRSPRSRSYSRTRECSIGNPVICSIIHFLSFTNEKPIGLA